VKVSHRTACSGRLAEAWQREIHSTATHQAVYRMSSERAAQASTWGCSELAWRVLFGLPGMLMLGSGRLPKRCKCT